MAAKGTPGQPEGDGQRGQDGQRDGVIVATIAAGGTREAAAAASGASARTVYRRLNDPEVAAAIADARARIARDVLTRAADNAAAAVDTLARIMRDADAPEAARIAAARTLLQVAGTYGQAAELAGRVEALEAALRARR